MSTRHAQAVRCVRCPFVAKRVYVQVDELPRAGCPRPQGFGVCFKCGAAMVKIVKTSHRASR